MLYLLHCIYYTEMRKKKKVKVCKLRKKRSLKLSAQTRPEAWKRCEMVRTLSTHGLRHFAHPPNLNHVTTTTPTTARMTMMTQWQHKKPVAYKINCKITVPTMLRYLTNFTNCACSFIYTCTRLFSPFTTTDDASLWRVLHYANPFTHTVTCP